VFLLFLPILELLGDSLSGVLFVQGQGQVRMVSWSPQILQAHLLRQHYVRYCALLHSTVRSNPARPYAQGSQDSYFAMMLCKIFCLLFVLATAGYLLLYTSYHLFSSISIEVQVIVLSMSTYILIVKAMRGHISTITI
jgi:hypothetical protein